LGQQNAVSYKIILTMPDEIIVETREDSAAEVPEIIEECLEMAFHSIISEMPLN
jgi:DNA polymerase I-like protein with 3'-5' exonuclease and polymerase domains